MQVQFVSIFIPYEVEQPSVGADRQKDKEGFPMKRLASLLAILWIGMLGVIAPSAQALDFALHPLEELAGLSDTIVVGTVTEQSDSVEEGYKLYRVAVQRSFKGDAEAGATISMSILQWADEGVLYEGKQYLLLLKHRQEKMYQVAGVHQGFIQIENDSMQSRFYSPEEVHRFLAAQGISVESFPAPVSGGDQKGLLTLLPAPALPAMIFLVALVGGIAWLLWRRSRKAS
jgi:hypothetical protein